jgi:hypothetical protein
VTLEEFRHCCSRSIPEKEKGAKLHVSLLPVPFTDGGSDELYLQRCPCKMKTQIPLLPNNKAPLFLPSFSRNQRSS